METILKITKQRGKRDCGIAALSTLSGKPYDEVYTKAAETTQTVAKGLSLGEIEETASKLGLTLERKRKYDLDEDSGILSVRVGNLEHVVVLAKGVIIDSQPGTVHIDIDQYKAQENVKLGVLLRVKD